MLKFPAFLLLASCLFSVPSPAQVLDTVRVAQSLSQPLFAGSPQGDYERIFIVEQYTGMIRLLKNGTLLPSPFLNIGSLVIDSGNERGLLGLAFHPNYAQNGYFFVNYINNSGSTVIARYTRSGSNPDVADGNSGLIFLTQSQPFTNHNGGMLAFGPDGYLYCGMGDGGSGGDPNDYAQNVNTLLGKMIRLNVDVPGPNFPYTSPPSNPFSGTTPGLDEIWAVGLRNPFRFSFDRVTGELYIGDVGQNAREEISYQPALDPANPSAVAGRNYGWRCREGIANYNTTGCTGTYINPIHDYPQGTNGFCVTGGYVYRGCAIPAIYGHYFFADYSSAKIWSFRYAGGTVQNFLERTADLAPGGGLSINNITSFGQDASGELYIVKRGSTVSSTGELYKIVPAAAVPAIPSLAVTTPVAIGTTGSVQLTSSADPNEPYIIGFALATSPPILLADQRIIPITYDVITDLALTPGNGIFSGTSGSLDGSGQATATIAVPNFLPLVGLQIFAAGIVANPLSPAGVEDISCALPITIQ